jgi:hypothetical protein
MSSNQHLSSQRNKRCIQNCLLGSLLVVVASIFLINCGGGSGGGEDVKSIAPGGALNPGLVGTIWRPGDGLAYDSIDAGSGRVRERNFVARVENPNPILARDLRLALFFNTRASPQTTTFEVSEFKGWDYSITQGFPERKPKPLYESGSDFDYHQLYLSPDSRCMAYIYGDDSPVLATQYALKVLDFQNQADVTKVKPVLAYGMGLQNRKIAGFDWLPNGEYMFVYTDGTLMRGSCINHGQVPKAVGRIKPPATYDIAVGYQTFAISPDGTKIAVELMGDAKVKDAVQSVNVEDIWITDITGGNMQRLTVGDKSSQPIWSPDGQWIALGYETYINSAKVPLVEEFREAYTGSRWYIPSAARNVNPPKVPGETGRFLREAYGGGSWIVMSSNPITMMWTK